MTTSELRPLGHGPSSDRTPARAGAAPGRSAGAPARTSAIALAAACLVLSACTTAHPLAAAADRGVPPPLPAELAARFAYEKTAVEPALSPLEETEHYERVLGRYDAPCPVKGEAKRVTFEFWRSKVGSGPRPCILMIPILAGNYPECAHLGAFISENGMHAFFVHREEDLLAYGNEPADLEMILRRSVVNIRRTLDWAAARPDVDPERLGMVGISLGAIAGSIVCAVEPRLRRNVLIMGGADLARIFWESRETPVYRWKADHRRRWGARDLESFRARFAEGFLSDPAVYAPYVDARHVLQFIAEYDNKVPTPCQWQLWEALGKPRGWSIPIGHYTAIFYIGFAEEKALAFWREGFRLETGPKVARR